MFFITEPLKSTVAGDSIFIGFIFHTIKHMYLTTMHSVLVTYFSSCLINTMLPIKEICGMERFMQFSCNIITEGKELK